MAKKSNKIFVIDTSVILYDHNAIYNFEDNDVAIPITVFEELDNFKKGNDTINFEAREFIRSINKLALKSTLNEWIPINNGKGKFKVIMTENTPTIDATKIFQDNKADHHILNAALTLVGEYTNKKITLVSKDINLRLKAKSLNINSDDYLTGKIKDTENLFTGKSTIENVDALIIDNIYKNGFCLPEEVGITDLKNNKYLIIKSNNKSSVLAFYNSRTQKVEKIEKQICYKITPRNSEQIFALHAMLNPDVKLVSLQGVAGTGKTLLALAAALQQKKNYKQIYLARPIVPLSNKELGFLPGDANSKIAPYMEPLWDNLRFIKDQYKETDKEYKFLTDCVKEEKLVITPLAYIRGRSISNVFFIIDESQNLTPHEIKTIITRAGEGTKMVFTGDINQIDTPYLDSQSNGLSHLIDRMKNQQIYSHVTLEKGERSELANIANELL